MGKLGFTEILVLIVLPILYFLPVFIAFNRKAADRILILVLSIILGWTGLDCNAYMGLCR